MNIEIKAERRNKGKKSELNQMRKEGFIPAVIYSAGKQPTSIKVEKNLFMKEYRRTIGELVLFDVVLKDEEYHTVIKEKQIHPVTREIIHLDFLELKKDTKITVNLPLKFVGTPIGVKNGGSLEILLREIQVTCLPEDLLEDIEIDLSNLEIGHSLHINDLNLGKVELNMAADITIVVVHHPKIVVEVDESILAPSSEQETEETTE